MQYSSLGKSGLQVSVVGLGCNNFGRRCDESQTTSIVHAALDSGITFFDTADIYGPSGLSEEYLGKALKGHREEAVIASKFGGPMADDDPYMRGASRRYIMNAVEASLTRLNTDYIDLYQIHFPDPTTPLEETIRALDDLISMGKIRYMGNSNFAGWQIASSEWIARAIGTNRFISAQNEYSLLNRSIEAEVVPAAIEFGLSLLPYFPLGGGLLTGKYAMGEDGPEGARLTGAASLATRFRNPESTDKVEKLRLLSDNAGRTLLELAMSWLVKRPGVDSIISGATTPNQVRANATATSWILEDTELEMIDQITTLS
jgi:aryl-alcohol dehydrogenase-like predicted oxidoreductase